MPRDEPRRFRLSFGWSLATQLAVMSVCFGVVWGIGVVSGFFPRPQLLMAGIILTTMTLSTLPPVALAVWRLTLSHGRTGWRWLNWSAGR